MRWYLFAEKLKDDATADLDSIARDLDDRRWELNNPNPSPTTIQHRTRTRIGEFALQLADARKHKAEVREALWPPDEEEP